MSEKQNGIKESEPTQRITAEQLDDLEAASEAYFSLGLPVVAMKNKQPLSAWQRWQDTPQTLPEFNNQPWVNANAFAIVTGSKTREGLYFHVIDCDSSDFNVASVRTTQAEKTPRGGYHFVYHSRTCAKGQKNLDLKVELLGTGNLCIMYPSLGYSRMNDNFPSEVDSAADIYSELVKSLGGTPKRETVNVQKLLEGVPVGQRDTSAVKLATFFRKKGLTKQETIGKLEEWNKRNTEPLEPGILTQKTESAFSTPQPYNYKFDEESGEEDAAFPPIPTPIPYESAEKLEQEILDYVKARLDFTYEEEYAVFIAAIKLTWALEKFDSTPYLFFYGPKRSGKTRALKLLEQLCYRGFLALNATRATIYYLVDKYTPTLLLDESEVYTTDNPEAKEIVCLLNSGYTRGGKVMRLEPDEHNKRHLRFWKVFCLKALSGTRYVSDTLEDRCIVFKMTKNSYPIQSLDETIACTLRGKLAAWKKDFQDVSYVSSCPTTPLSDNNKDTPLTDARLQELFYPLLHVVSEKRLQCLISMKGKQTQDLWDSEARLSVDAEILEAMKSVLKTGGRFASGTVTDLVNGLKREDERIDPRTIGWTIRRLGFNKAPSIEGKQRSWWWDEQLWVKRAKQFGLETQLKPEGEAST